MTRKFSPDLVKIAARLYEECKSGDRVARRMDVSHSTAYRLLHAAGIALPDRHSVEVQNRKKRLQGPIAAAAATDYAAGLPIAGLAEKYECSAWAIRTAAKDAGVQSRRRGGRERAFSDEEIREMARLYTEERVSQATIAANFSTHQVTVGRVLRAAGIATRRKAATGAAHGSWRGGRIAASGYVHVYLDKADPLASMRNRMGYVPEHRLVMSRELGRPLSEYETVHHINGNPADNRIENLQLRFGKHGKGVAMACKNCGSHDITYQVLK